MDYREATRLKVGDRVKIWPESPDACTGTIIEKGYNAIKVKWDDDQIGVIHLMDMKDISRYCGKKNIIPTAA